MKSKKIAENWCWCNEHEKHQTDLLTNFGAKIQSLESSILSAIVWDGTTPFHSGLEFMKNSAKNPILLYSTRVQKFTSHLVFLSRQIIFFCTFVYNCLPLALCSPLKSHWGHEVKTLYWEAFIFETSGHNFVFNPQGSKSLSLKKNVSLANIAISSIYTNANLEQVGKFLNQSKEQIWHNMPYRKKNWNWKYFLVFIEI